MTIKQSFKKSSLAENTNIIFFVVLLIWWMVLFFGFDTQLEKQNLYWAASYQLIAIWGVIWGIFASKKWGGLKSVMGKSIAFFTTGLFLQVFGQSSFSFYNLILKVEIPYPSIPDIGYFGSIPFFILGGIYLGKAAGVQFSLNSFFNKIQVVAIPAFMVALSYIFFLRDYSFSEISPLQIFLDFGYPIGQAFYISIAILVYLLSKNFLGGIMKYKVLLILFGLVMQYISDYNFLFQNLKGTWINGGYGDVLYMFTYFLMTYGLIKIANVFRDESKEKII